MPVTETYMVGIRTRYYGPTDHRGSRITAWRSDEPSPRTDEHSVTVHWEYERSIPGNHAHAVEAYIAERERLGHQWDGEWLVAAGHDGYMAVSVPRKMALIKEADEPT